MVIIFGDRGSTNYHYQLSHFGAFFFTSHLLTSPYLSSSLENSDPGSRRKHLRPAPYVRCAPSLLSREEPRNFFPRRLVLAHTR